MRKAKGEMRNAHRGEEQVGNYLIIIGISLGTLKPLFEYNELTA